MTGESFAGLTLARVLRPWGRRGEVAAEILTDFPKRLAAVREAWLYDGRKPPRPVRIVSCRIHLGQAILHFAGTESIDDAERLRGLEVQVPLAERAPIGAGRYYLSELIGCTVWEQAAAGDESGAVSAGVREAEAVDAEGPGRAGRRCRWARWKTCGESTMEMARALWNLGCWPLGRRRGNC